MPDRATQIIESNQIAITGVMGFISWLLAYVKVDVEIMTLFTIFVIIDTVTGVIRAELDYLDTHIKTFKSSILIKGVVKKIMFIMLPLMAGAVGTASGKDMTMMTDSVLWLLILKELYSFVSTLHYLTYGTSLPEWNILGKIGRTIRSAGGR